MHGVIMFGFFSNFTIFCYRLQIHLTCMKKTQYQFSFVHFVLDDPVVNDCIFNYLYELNLQVNMHADNSSTKNIPSTVAFFVFISEDQLICVNSFSFSITDSLTRLNKLEIYIGSRFIPAVTNF